MSYKEFCSLVYSRSGRDTNDPTVHPPSDRGRIERIRMRLIELQTRGPEARRKLFVTRSRLVGDLLIITGRGFAAGKFA